MKDEQPIKISEQDAALITRTFADNEALLKAIRALFLGLGVTDDEKTAIKTAFANDDIKALMARRFYPQLSKDSPIGQVQDVWLGAEGMIFGQSQDAMKQAYEYKAMALDMTKQALTLLDNPDGTPINLEVLAPANDPLYIGLLARNQFIRHVESQLLFLWIIANQKQTTPETAAQTAVLDSSK